MTYFDAAYESQDIGQSHVDNTIGFGVLTFE